MDLRLKTIDLFAKWLHQQCARTVASKVSAHQEALMARGLPKRAPLPAVDKIIVVASGKGGVGKSTIAVNLAVTLASFGKRIGLLDADIFGPSIPLMMGVHEEPAISEPTNEMIPPINYGVKCLSMGLLTSQRDAIVWRGPLVMSALQRLLKGTAWGPLDILVIDTPPGTGDVHLSLAQNVPISGVILVSTPQKAALEITQRGAQMYRKLGVPIFGLVENMGHIVCNNCQNRMQIFPDSVEAFVSEMQISRLASLPMDGTITECCESGQPMVAKHRDSAYAQSFKHLAKVLLKELQLNEKNDLSNCK